MSKPIVNSRPTRPHFHTCRACSHRHKWPCKSTTCNWSIFLSCPTGKSRAAAGAAAILRGLRG